MNVNLYQLLIEKTHVLFVLITCGFEAAARINFNSRRSKGLTTNRRVFSHQLDLITRAEIIATYNGEYGVLNS